MGEDTTIVSVSDIAGHPMHLRSMSGDEALGGRPEGGFEYHLELLSLDTEIKPSEVLGQKATINLKLAGDSVRYFNGYVGQFSYAGMFDTYAIYHATIRPWLWFLNFTADCRVFPEKTVPEIVKSVFRKYGQADFAEVLGPDYPSYNYVVQYRETDFNFISRLLQQEGIYYFFEHTAEKHTLVLADGLSAHKEVPGYAQIPYIPPTESGHTQRSHFNHWKVYQDIKPDAYALNDFNFEKVKVDRLARRQSIPDEERYSTGELFDYPGLYLEQERGKTLADLRIQQLHEESQTIEVEGNPFGLGVGNIFTMPNPPRSDKGIQFLAASAHYELRSADPRSGSGAGDEDPFIAKYILLPTTDQFRPPRTAAKPTVFGPQTAIVVGAKKTAEADPEEILTDPYGRVRVRFHWERIGTKRPEIRGTDDQDIRDEDNTCWIRVAQMWAGKGWGSIHIPRIGQEVVVEFLEGNPDRPLITGSVYNADNMPPYTLPDNKTQSGIKSRSTKGGTANNFNEIRFEDLKGKEELHMQAERDMSTHVKRNQSTSVDGDRSVSVGGNHSVSVTGTQSTTVTKDETQTYKAKRKMDVTGTNDDTITGAHKGIYKAGRTEEVTAGDKLTVTSKDKTISVLEGAFDIDVKQHLKVTKATTTMTIDDNFVVEASGKVNLHNPGTSVIGEGTKLALKGNSEVTITCGAASISMKSDGTIEITGTKVKIGNANNNAAFEPAGTTINGVKITSASVGMHEISGALIKVG